MKTTIHWLYIVYLYLRLLLSGCKNIQYWKYSDQEYITFIITRRTKWLDKVMFQYNEDYAYAKILLR